MPVPAINVPFREPDFDRSSGRSVLVNFEPTSACALTNSCGNACILAHLHKHAAPEMPRGRMESLIEELMSGPGSAHARYVVAAAKEPTEAPDMMKRFARLWHESPATQRALSIGMITASPLGVRNLCRELVDTPLGFALISVDTDRTGLRTQPNNHALLKATSEAVKMGGLGKFGVNTLVASMEDLPAIEAIGRAVHAAGAEQWTLGSFLEPGPHRMVPVLDMSDYLQLVEWADQTFASSGLRITLDAPSDVFHALAPHNPTPTAGRWRYEQRLTSTVEVQTLPLQPGFFLRVRWDTQQIALRELLEIGTVKGRYGAYTPGRLAQTMRQVVGEQSNSAPEINATPLALRTAA